MDWYRERGLVKDDEITTHYAGGRIDIYGVPGEHYPLEYGLSPMHGEDWNALSDWLDDLTTTELWEYDMMISIFEAEILNGRSIRWAKDLEDWRNYAQ
jgi:hypothetical protein